MSASDLSSIRWTCTVQWKPSVAPPFQRFLFLDEIRQSCLYFYLFIYYCYYCAVSWYYRLCRDRRRFKRAITGLPLTLTFPRFARHKELAGFVFVFCFFFSFFSFFHFFSSMMTFPFCLSAFVYKKKRRALCRCDSLRLKWYLQLNIAWRKRWKQTQQQAKNSFGCFQLKLCVFHLIKHTYTVQKKLDCYNLI